ncbi:carboxylesterase family protein [Nafulsella turpanensis]|uniref:carboxylesterase family protein n=1 Tax=Nafulsella turpanensis TaxID=1265690 RepID=UPI0003476A43|nr:prolyl oligopeptidase family serine peptidase [Nafulsella turpanensis]
MAGYPYEIFYPGNYHLQPGKKWPLILFLHGAGERGSNMSNVRLQGIPDFLRGRKDFPFIVAYPQCPAGEYWTIPLLNDWYEKVLAEVDADESRVYLTGLSMGGYGTWYWAAAHPEKFAAIIPVCGGGEPSKAKNLIKMPTWAFHGQKDNIVPVEETLQMVEAIRAAGGHPKVTIYPDAFHDSWTPTYTNPDIYSWLLGHRKGD